MHRARATLPIRRLLALAVVLAVAGAVAGCSGGGAVNVDPNPNKPFVLAGVSDLTQIAQLTGPGAVNDTEAAAVAGTDLGSMVTIDDRTYFIFGDTFGERDPESIGGQGSNWRSNVMAFTTDDDPSDGITFDGWAPSDDLGWAMPIIEGEHDANDSTGEVTKIPTYGFAIGQTLYVQYMSVKFWGEPGAWDANFAGLAKSTDQGATWTALDDPKWPGDSNFIQVATAHVTEQGTEYVYFWSIPSGRFGGVQLMRVPATEAAVEDAAAYSYFTGVNDDNQPQWSADMGAASTVIEGTIGELSVMWSDYLERWIMTYSDGGNAYIREGITPWGPWGDPIEMARASEYPGLYSPYMSPRYVADGGKKIYFSMSLWGPYNVFWFSINLDKAS